MTDDTRGPDKIRIEDVLGPSEEDPPEEIEVLDGTAREASESASAAEGASFEQLTAARAETETYRDLYLRSRADLDNLRKRMEREREQEQAQAGAALAKDLLPALDNLGRALESAPAGDPFAEGVVLIERQLREALRRAGLEPIEAVGEPFDPVYHEAVMTEPTTRLPAGTVLEEAQKGYTFRGRVLRPALVKVAVQPEAPPAGAPPEAAETGDGPDSGRDAQR